MILSKRADPVPVTAKKGVRNESEGARGGLLFVHTVLKWNSFTQIYFELKIGLVTVALSDSMAPT